MTPKNSINSESTGVAARDMAHTECPTGYREWFFWADEMAKTHKQVKCPCCGLYKIWVKK